MTCYFGHELAIVVIVCVLGIFLFPAAAGPYSAVHGPVTALRAMRSSIRLRWAIARTARFCAADIPVFHRSFIRVRLVASVIGAMAPNSGQVIF